MKNNNYIAFVGAPNSGKTTLYNRLTKSSHKTVNYPGSTVDYAYGMMSKDFGEAITLVDTPGTYSLFPKSQDEVVTHELLFHPKFPPKVIVATIDVTQISRQLVLVKQLIEANFVVIVALTMVDLVDGSLIDVQSLSSYLGCSVVKVSAVTNKGIDSLVREIEKRSKILPHAPRTLNKWEPKKYEKILRETKEIEKNVFQKKIQIQSKQRTALIDQYLLQPVLGLVLFVLIMFGLFSSIFWLATPFMDWVDQLFGYLAQTSQEITPYPLLADFLGNGVFGAVGAVMVFVPQIAILFLGISILEDSGYLARACSLIDKPLSKIGLNGRSFVPLLSGYACAIPAMMAARSMTSKKEKFITLFIIPLMSCSARLPVYALLLSFLFWKESPWKPALAMVGIYMGSIIVGSIAATIVNRFIKIKSHSFFIQELPYYRRPNVGLVLYRMMSKTWSYLKNAGPIIFLFAIIFWAATTFPNYQEESDVVRLETSYAASVGKILEPVMHPMGGDWRTGTALVAAFTAREVFVSALALVFQIADTDEDSIQNSIIQKMKSAQNKYGMPLFTFSSVLGLIVFFMIALQCMSTVAVAVREFGGWKWPLIQLFSFTFVSYLLAVFVVQGLRFFGVS